MALLEYDLEPQQLALDVASGAIDLALEGELLRERDRRAIAEVEASRLAGLAIERIDAQRTVRRETVDMLGEADRPWLGITLREPDVVAALEEATARSEERRVGKEGRFRRGPEHGKNSTEVEVV